jgi:hypothetical protein
MLRSDLFVILDHVQFERRNYQNRTLIRLKTGEVAHRSVVQLSQKEKIIDKRVDNPEDLSGTRWWGPIRSRRCATYRVGALRRLRAEAEGIFHARWDKLLDLNMATRIPARGTADRYAMLSSTLAPDGQRSSSCSTSARRSVPRPFMAEWVDRANT